MRGISNYVAAVLTVAMIFTSIAFFISFMLRQIEISNYALNTMVKISDRARENLGISYVFPNNQTIIITIVNRGTIETTPTYVIVIDKNFTMYKVSVNATSIPIGAVVNLKLQLPIPRNQLEAIKVATERGNVFDVLSSTVRPLDMFITTNTTYVGVNDYVEIDIVIKNNLYRSVLLDRQYINLTLVDHVTGEDITQYFVEEGHYPDEPIAIPPGGQVTYKIIYRYGGGLPYTTRVDIVVNINTVTTMYEEVYSSATSYYAFKASG